ncbi:modulator of FtsH protease HflC [Caedimonas varicaedens]|jgi:membrane protease subunit HflC|uniref:Protein HflC n=1 Tax=Caedimonas varicaedens TaxID=1629334 RepID=A0A0K8MAF2_9PROT|nr:modulator of FtsH protease HflC [Caedimonas varicaedens]
MKQTTLTGIVAFGVALLILVSSSFFIVNQTENALVLQFGKMVHVVETPGLKLKVPFIQDVKFFDRQLLTYNLPVIEVNAGDQKRMVVDMYLRYRITDVLTFFKNVGTKEGLQNRLGKIMPDIMQEVIGRVTLSEMLSQNRANIMSEIQKKAQASAKAFGIDISDVRIIRADLPSENSEAIFNRMESERRQEAKQFRAEGNEQAQGIRAKAERERTVLIAEARKKSEILRGEGDSEATRIYAEAFGKDKEFFEFYRSMMAYKEALGDQTTTLVLSPNSSFFRFMGQNGK